MVDVRRVAVIGAGVVGACVAYYLVREGANVVLVDAGEPGKLTTNASFAWVNASSKADHPAYFALNAAGLTEYEVLLRECADTTWWHAGGHVRWDYSDQHALFEHVTKLQARGYPAEVWEAERVQRVLEPNVVFGSGSQPVAVFPSEAWVDGPEMVRAVISSAVKKGAMTAFGSEVTGITTTDRTVSSVYLRNGESYAVDSVVNAAGPAASSVAAFVGRRLAMKDEPGLAVRVATGSTGLVGRVLHAPEIAMRPDGAGRSFLLARGIEPSLTKGRSPSAELAESVKRLAARVVPELAAAPVMDVRVGQRAIPSDGFPAIGKASDIDGYYEAVMHSGITLAPIVARALTAEILHADIDPLVSSFRATRLGRHAEPAH